MLASCFFWGGIPSAEQAITSCKYKLPTELRTMGDVWFRCQQDIYIYTYVIRILYIIYIIHTYYTYTYIYIYIYTHTSIQVGNQPSESKGCASGQRKTVTKVSGSEGGKCSAKLKLKNLRNVGIPCRELCRTLNHSCWQASYSGTWAFRLWLMI